MDDLKHLPSESANDANDKLLTTEEVAAWLCIKKCTLEKARSMRTGNFPPFVRIGRAIRYQRSAVQAWIQSNAYNIDGSKAA